MEELKLLDVVALTDDQPEHNLRRGQVGTVVEILAGGNAVEVDFSDTIGRTFKTSGLEPRQLLRLRYEPGSLAA